MNRLHQLPQISFLVMAGNHEAELRRHTRLSSCQERIRWRRKPNPPPRSPSGHESEEKEFAGRFFQSLEAKEDWEKAGSRPVASDWAPDNEPPFQSPALSNEQPFHRAWACK